VLIFKFNNLHKVVLITKQINRAVEISPINED